MNKDRHYVLKLEPYEGDFSALSTWFAENDGLYDPMYIVIAIDDKGEARVCDYGYKSHEEAQAAMAEASN